MYVYKVALIGDSGVGKTSILEYFINNNIYTTPTIGSGYYSYKLDENTTLNIWDTAGQERYRSLIPTYYRGSDICIIVFDLSNYKIKDVENWIDVYTENTNNNNIILVGNKVDVSEGGDLHYLSARYKLFKTSAIDGTNIESLFNYIKSILPAKEPKIIQEPLSNYKKNCCLF